MWQFKDGKWKRKDEVPMKITLREEEILCRVVSYEQFRELEDQFKTLRVRFNELLEYLANTTGNDHLRSMKVKEE